MLSRRFLRIKVLQALYAFHLEGPESINAGEKQLLISLDKLYELFIYQFSLILEIQSFARQRMEENKLKFLPTPEDLNPNLRFINNRFLAQLSENRDLNRKIEAYKFNWADEIEMIRKLYQQIREMEEYQSFMAKDKVSYADEKGIVETAFLKVIAESEVLQSFFEEKNLYWSDDFDLSLMMVVKTIRAYRQDQDEFTAMPPLLKDENDQEGSEDRKFVRELYRKVVIHSKDFDTVIASHAENWDLDRIALMDTLLIKMALTEFVDFPFIPVKVSLNEYIELSKSFSTPRSKVFINGMLDKLIVELKADKKIVKTGRGLLE